MSKSQSFPKERSHFYSWTKAVWLQGALESGLNAAKEIHFAGSTVSFMKR
ncbi:hypothetical protein [Nostoc sp. 106C]|nr:hypothetical protein [Nostoc sp. 106C]